MDERSYSVFEFALDLSRLSVFPAADRESHLFCIGWVSSIGADLLRGGQTVYDSLARAGAALGFETADPVSGAFRGSDATITRGGACIGYGDWWSDRDGDVDPRGGSGVGVGRLDQPDGVGQYR